MSEENVEIVRRAIEEFEREDLDASLRYYDPEVEWTTTGAFVDQETFRGHEGLRHYVAAFTDDFDNLRGDLEELVGVDERVVASVRVSGRGKATGAPVELTLHSVIWLRHRMIYRVRSYTDRAEALEAAGLSE